MIVFTINLWYNRLMVKRHRAETGPHIPMIDDWYAYPEVSDVARITEISDSEYLLGRRLLLRAAVQNCMRYGMYIADEAQQIAEQTNHDLVDQMKPEHVETWADFHRDFEQSVHRYLNPHPGGSDGDGRERSTG